MGALGAGGGALVAVAAAGRLLLIGELVGRGAGDEGCLIATLLEHRGVDLTGSTVLFLAPLLMKRQMLVWYGALARVMIVATWVVRVYFPFRKVGVLLVIRTASCFLLK